jgi:hypothetical protein
VPEPPRPWRRRAGRLVVDDRDGNNSDPGGTPAEFEYDSADANIALDNIYASMDTELLLSSFGDAAMSYTCSSVGDMLVSATSGVDPIPIPKNARAALKDPIYGDKLRLAMQTKVEGKFVTNKCRSETTGVAVSPPEQE